MKRLTKNLMLLGVITVIEAGVFSHYNHLLSAAAAETGITATAPPADTKPETLPNIHLLSDNLIAVSDDGQRLVYVDKNLVLHTVDFATGKTLYTLQLRFQPIYLRWIRDDSLFIGTQAVNGSLIDLRLSTITLSSGKVRLIHVFSGFSTDATFRNVTFSPYTNDVYILIDGKSSSVMYHYDTNGNLNQVDVGGRVVTKAASTPTGNTVYFQDFAQNQPNFLMRDNAGTVTVLQRDAVLLRLIGTTAYYGKLDSQGNVTEIDTYTSSTDNGQGNSSGNTVGTSTTASSGNTNKSTELATTSTALQSKVLMRLSTPTPPNQIYMTNNAEVVVAAPAGVMNLTTKRKPNIPSGSQAIIHSNGLLFVAPSGTITFVR